MLATYTFRNVNRQVEADLAIVFSAAVGPDELTVTLEGLTVEAFRLLDWHGCTVEGFRREDGTLSVESAATLGRKFTARLEVDAKLREDLTRACRRHYTAVPACV
jgi:hypothetical protein